MKGFFDRVKNHNKVRKQASGIEILLSVCLGYEKPANVGFNARASMEILFCE